MAELEKFAESYSSSWLFAGQQEGPVCYYYGKRETVYEDLGHAEVVQLDLTSNPEKEMEMFANTYFQQFKKTRCAVITNPSVIVQGLLGWELLADRAFQTEAQSIL